LAWQILEGIRAHNQVKIDPYAGRISITKASIFKESFRFKETYLAPLFLPFIMILR